MAETEDIKDASVAPREAAGGPGGGAPGGPTAGTAVAAPVGAANAARPAQDTAPRIGVFICSCGEELSRAMDLSAIQADCRALEGVVFAGVEPYPCSRPGLVGMREVIEANRLNRVVVAGCTPRLHGKVFADACEKAGLNRWLVEFANIREHCARVHSDKAPATEKAKDLVRGAVTKVRHAKPLVRIGVNPLNSVLVIGAGISGLTVAAKLVQSGHEVTLIEKSGEPGGNLNRMANVHPFARSGRDVVKKAIAAVEGKVEIMKNTTLTSLRGGPGRYAVTLGPTGSAAGGGTAPSREGGGAEGGKSDASGAADTRPVGKVAAAGDGERSFGAIVVATGGEWVTIKELLVALQKATPAGCAAEDAYLHAAAEFYAKLPAFTGRVLTQAGLETELAAGSLKSVRRALFLNVAPGARPETRLNSLVALKNSVALRQASPETEVTLVFNRIPSEYERDFRRAKEHGVRFVWTKDVDAPDFTLTGVRVTAAAETGGPPADRGGDAGAGAPAHVLNLEADIVVVPTMSVPSAETRALAKLLRIPVDSSGFFVEPHVKLRPGDFAERALFVVGACHAPATVFECLAQAGDAAARASKFLTRTAGRAPFVSHIDERVCRGCGRCAEACEWDAIEMTTLENGLKLAKVDEAACTGCGVCATVCICGAPALAPVRREQVRAMVGAMFDGR